MAAALRATSDPTLQEYLQTIPVEYVVGMPACGGGSFVGGIQLRYAQGCFYGDRIEVGVLDWNRATPWLYQDEICAVLDHELNHALQQALTCHTWHRGDIQ